MPDSRFLFAVCITIAIAGMGGSGRAGQRPRLVHPPMFRGGLAGLPEQEHLFIKNTYGDIELLNAENTSYHFDRESLTDTSLLLFAMGNFLPEGLQYATLGRFADKPGHTLLLLFEWRDERDSASGQGVFFHKRLERGDVLLRNRQGPGGLNDTLELFCADRQSVCGTCYYDRAEGRMRLEMTDR